MAKKDNRTIFDLTDEEYEAYQENPELFEQISRNSFEDALDMMFDRDEDFNDDDDGIGSFLDDYYYTNKRSKIKLTQ